MTVYVLRNGRCVNKATGEPMERLHGISAPRVLSDIAAYRSPLGDGVIEGRAARREHLKRNNCREVDPSEFKPTYRNPEFAAKRGLPLDHDGARDAAKRHEQLMRDRLNEAAHDSARLMYENRN